MSELSAQILPAAITPRSSSSLNWQVIDVGYVASRHSRAGLVRGRPCPNGGLRGGRSSPLFLLRPLDHPLDQLRLDSPAKPRRIVEPVAQIDMQAQCLGLKRLDQLVRR
jgi:hypothetical protein